MQDTEFQALIDQARRGDGRAWKDLVVAVQPSLLHFAARLPAINGHQESLSQETWLRAFKAIGTFRGQTFAMFRSWLYRIAHNVQCRPRKPPWPPVSLPPVGQRDSSAGPLGNEPAGDDPTPSEEAEAAERRRRIEQALESLAPEQSEAILLHIHKGLPFVQIAALWDCHESTVRFHYKSGLQRLGPQLKGLV